MREQLFMGLDIGTTGVRAALFDMNGMQKGLYYREYPSICTEYGMLELDPELVFRSLVEVIKGCTEQAGAEGRDIQAVGLSSQMHSVMALDGKGMPLTNVLTWADSRPLKQAGFINREFDCRKLYGITGCRVQHPLYPLSKILWIRDEKPDIFRRTAKFTSLKSYIIFRLFGEMLMDITDASATGYYDIHAFDWNSCILDNIIGIDRSKLPETVECTCIVRGMKEEYAAGMGIDAGTPFVVGSGDGILANIGCGGFDDTVMSCTVGTSGALRIAVGKPLLDDGMRTWCYCFTKDTWVAGGAVNNGGIVLKWLRDEYRKQFEAEASEAGIKSVYALFDLYASQTAAGSDGLVFLPFLTGERSPGWNADARGTLHGLRLMHGKRHLVRAVMEGVMYRLYSVFEILYRLDSNVKKVVANGGYVNSDIWLQIQADIFGKEIAVAGISEASVFGAAYVAMAAAGAVRDLKTPLPMMQPSRAVGPSGRNAAVYENGYRTFMDIYEKLK